MIGKAIEAGKLLRKHFREEKARLEGKAVSHARMIKPASEIPGIQDRLGNNGPARPIQGATIRMLDGKPMTYYTDGSLRHALGRRLGKAGRKLLKRARRRAHPTSQAHR